jgi:hypothetical protein
MTWAIRSCALAVGAAALLSTQAVYAAPVKTAPAVDPLVSLSVLGTAQSRAAVCGTGTTCALPMTMAASGATASPALTTGTMSAAVMQGEPGKRIDPLLLALGAAIIIAIIVAILSGGGDGDGDLTPVSPA